MWQVRWVVNVAGVRVASDAKWSWLAYMKKVDELASVDEMKDRASAVIHSMLCEKDAHL